MKKYVKYLLRHLIYVLLGLVLVYIFSKSRGRWNSQDSLTFEQICLLALLFLFIVTSKYYFLEKKRWKEKFHEKFK